MLEERLERWYKGYGKKILFILLAIVIIYFIFHFKIIGLFAPFILAFIFATLLNKVVTWGNKKLHIPRGIGTIISMLTILSGILAIVVAIFRRLWEQIVNFAGTLPQSTENIIDQINDIEEKLGTVLPMFMDSEAFSSLDDIVTELMASVSSFLSSIIPIAYDAVSKVPDIILFTIAMLLATFFMTKDYYKIKDFVKAQFSDTIVDKIVIMQRGMIEAIGGYVRTQVILMSITFTICLTGLALFNVSYALLLAVIIAIVDALPIFGSGAILWPWGIYNLLIGNYTLGIGLFCIYGIIFVVRQIMEPKILSSQIGVYALVTLMAVYIGYKILGFIGLILGPALVVTLQMLQNVGALPKFKPVKKTEGEENEKYRDKNNH